MKFPHVVGASGCHDFGIDVPSIDVPSIDVPSTDVRSTWVAAFAKDHRIGEKPNTFRSKTPIRFPPNKTAAGGGGGRLERPEASYGEARFS
jgi:hypothetical protein